MSNKIRPIRIRRKKGKTFIKLDKKYYLDKIAKEKLAELNRIPIFLTNKTRPKIQEIRARKFFTGEFGKRLGYSRYRRSAQQTNKDVTASLLLNQQIAELRNKIGVQDKQSEELKTKLDKRSEILTDLLTGKKSIKDLSGDEKKIAEDVMNSVLGRKGEEASNFIKNNSELRQNISDERKKVELVSDANTQYDIIDVIKKYENFADNSTKNLGKQEILSRKNMNVEDDEQTFSKTYKTTDAIEEVNEAANMEDVSEIQPKKYKADTIQVTTYEKDRDTLKYNLKQKGEITKIKTEARDIRKEYVKNREKIDELIKKMDSDDEIIKEIIQSHNLINNKRNVYDVSDDEIARYVAANRFIFSKLKEEDEEKVEETKENFEIVNNIPEAQNKDEEDDNIFSVSNINIGSNAKGLSSNGIGINMDDINDVMKSVPHFLGCVFESDVDTIIERIKREKPLVFSFILLVHNYLNGGSNHYVAYWGDLKFNKELCYYDSYANDPSNDILKKLKTLFEDDLEIPYMLKLKYNKIQNQGLNSDVCAIHAMYYIFMRMFGFSHKETTKFNDYDENDKRFLKSKYYFSFI